MSEFTEGNVLLEDSIDIIRNKAPKNSVIKVLDDKWLVLLTKDNYADFNEEIPDYIMQISMSSPILYFFNYEDHLWGYRLVINAKEVAKLRISYEFEEELIFKLIEEMYPEEDMFDVYDEKYGQLKQYIIDNNLILKELTDIFEAAQAEEFRSFNLSNDQISELKRILSLEYYKQKDNIFKFVDEFKNTVGITEMSRINYQRAIDFDEYDEIIE